MAAQREGVHSGFEHLVGLEGDVRVPVSPIGQVFVDGALWRAEAVDGLEEEAIPSGARVSVEAVEGLTLRVRPVEIKETTEGDG
jgi:membrane protein implicated in regulation of membrane protease activity